MVAHLPRVFEVDETPASGSGVEGLVSSLFRSDWREGRVGKVAQQAKVHSAKFNDLSLIPGTHMVREKSLLQVVFLLPRVCHGMNTRTQIKGKDT